MAVKGTLLTANSERTIRDRRQDKRRGTATHTSRLSAGSAPYIMCFFLLCRGTKDPSHAPNEDCSEDLRAANPHVRLVSHHSAAPRSTGQWWLHTKEVYDVRRTSPDTYRIHPSLHLIASRTEHFAKAQEAGATGSPQLARSQIKMSKHQTRHQVPPRCECFRNRGAQERPGLVVEAHEHGSGSAMPQ
ncbi:hypothetical protein LIA77_04615 [Sarocladium implicatum]|nr:hypothetical protein LIA77_04615 [Sarocladium implicatum]